VAVEVAEPTAEQQEAAVREQASEVSEKPRSSLIEGSATLTIVASSTIIRLPSVRT
jgi:hypothetical protein